jgi:hypothetical protein
MNFKLRYMIVFMLVITGHAKTETSDFDSLFKSAKEEMSKKCAQGDAESCLALSCIDGTGDKASCKALQDRNATARNSAIDDVTSPKDKALKAKLTEECKTNNQKSCNDLFDLGLKNMRKAVDGEQAIRKTKCDAGNAEACSHYKENKALLDSADGK